MSPPRAVAGVVTTALALGALAPAAARAQGADAPPAAAVPPREALRAGNAAAIEGDWRRVSQLVDPLVDPRRQGGLAPGDRAEAHRLAGLAALFEGRRAAAEAHFLEYLRLDLDGQLDPALYPPEAITFFSEVRAKHEAELRARRPRARRYWVLNLLPPWGQFQNGERTKGYVVGGLLGGLVVANLTSYLVLRAWCTETRGDLGIGASCDDGSDRTERAGQLQAINLASAIGVFATYVYGVYDGARGYRQRRTVQPYVASTPDGGFVGVAGSF